MEKKKEDKRKRKGYWYMTHIRECVLCGAGETTRYRVYDEPKPANPWDRYEYEQFACWSHFL